MSEGMYFSDPQAAGFQLADPPIFTREEALPDEGRGECFGGPSHGAPIDEQEAEAIDAKIKRHLAGAGVPFGRPPVGRPSSAELE